MCVCVCVCVHRKRVASVVSAGIERAQEVAVVFEDAASVLSIDPAPLLAELSPVDTPLQTYMTHIGRFRAAAQAANNAAPNEVRNTWRHTYTYAQLNALTDTGARQWGPP